MLNQTALCHFLAFFLSVGPLVSTVSSQNSPDNLRSNAHPAARIAQSTETFRVTRPDSQTLNSQLVEVQWEVANTNRAPLNCRFVNIRLSTDGGQSFATRLTSRTPNDGNQLVALPPAARNQLRFQVEGADNALSAVNPNIVSVMPAHTSIFLVRHAEKEQGDDPNLTPVGQARARALSDLMTTVEVTHVFSTDTNRTRQTAQPTASRTGIPIQIYASTPELVTAMATLPRGSRILVVGHSNTVGPIATALGANQQIQIGNEFDNLLAVSRRVGGTRIEQFKYQPDDVVPPQPDNAIGTALEMTAPAAGSDRTNGLWQEPQDTEAAINSPDLYAWKLFVALNWPADVAARMADKDRMFGENADTVWESWKLSSGENDEVFLKDGVDPGPWISADPRRMQQEGQQIERNTRDFEREPLQQLQGLRRNMRAAFDDDRSPKGLNENHINRAGYDFIRENELYNIDGQEQLFAEAKQKFDQARAAGRAIAPHEYKLHFPVGAKEVKAQWRQISVEDKPRYRWAEFKNRDGSIQLYGLTSLHITTKDIPNWFWATFEHVDNPPGRARKRGRRQRLTHQPDPMAIRTVWVLEEHAGKTTVCVGHRSIFSIRSGSLPSLPILRLNPGFRRRLRASRVTPGRQLAPESPDRQVPIVFPFSNNCCPNRETV